MNARPTYPGFAQAVGAIAVVSAKEILRDRILYNVLVVSILVLIATYATSQVSFIASSRIIIDFGLTALQITGAALAILLGSGLIPREFERRTMFVSLARPITRPQFVFGKFAGLGIVLALNWALLSAVYIAMIAVNPPPGGLLASLPTLIWALGLSLFQALLASSVSILFSTFSTVSVSVMLSIGLYLIGNNTQYLRLLAAQTDSSFSAWVLKIISFLMPNYDLFNLGFKVTYALPLAAASGLYSILYACVATILILAVASWTIQWKDY